MTDLLYVHALADGRSREVRAAGRSIVFEPLDGIYAAVERRSEAPLPSEEELRAQHEIVRVLADAFQAVLPARFGSFVERAELARVINSRRDAIRSALDLVRGRVQMNVRLHGIGTQLPARVRGPSPARRQRPGTRYLLARRATTRPGLPAEFLRDLDALVRPLTAAERVEGGDGPAAARIYHLIERGSDRRYRQAIERAGRRLDRGVIQVTGPWPAFAFAPELWP